MLRCLSFATKKGPKLLPVPHLNRNDLNQETKLYLR